MYLSNAEGGKQNSGDQLMAWKLRKIKIVTASDSPAILGVW